MIFATRKALNRVNLRFYASQTAACFSETRQNPWPGWERVLAALPNGLSGKLKVLDVGCGNGRFATYLRQRCNAPFDYLGMDISPPLLEEARQRCEDPKRIRFVQADIVEDTSQRWLPQERYSLIVLFGLLHHIPGFEHRCELLNLLKGRLETGGFLVITFWRFLQYERFRDKVVTWEEYTKMSTEPIQETDLEKGDLLIKWGEGPRTVRYCHAANDDEIEEILSSLSLPCKDRYRADGRNDELNEYVVLENSI